MGSLGSSNVRTFGIVETTAVSPSRGSSLQPGGLRILEEKLLKLNIHFNVVTQNSVITLLNVFFCIMAKKVTVP
jgi:hypothetical protein